MCLLDARDGCGLGLTAAFACAGGCAVQGQQQHQQQRQPTELVPSVLDRLRLHHLHLDASVPSGLTALAAGAASSYFARCEAKAEKEREVQKACKVLGASEPHQEPRARAVDSGHRAFLRGTTLVIAECARRMAKVEIPVLFAEVSTGYDPEGECRLVYVIDPLCGGSLTQRVMQRQAVKNNWVFTVDGDENVVHDVLDTLGGLGAIRASLPARLSFDPQPLGDPAKRMHRVNALRVAVAVGDSRSSVSGDKRGSMGRRLARQGSKMLTGDRGDEGSEGLAIKLVEKSDKKEQANIRKEISLLLAAQGHPNVVRFFGLFMCMAPPADDSRTPSPATDAAASPRVCRSKFVSGTGDGGGEAIQAASPRVCRSKFATCDGGGGAISFSGACPSSDGSSFLGRSSSFFGVVDAAAAEAPPLSLPLASPTSPASPAPPSYTARRHGRRSNSEHIPAQAAASASLSPRRLTRRRFISDADGRGDRDFADPQQSPVAPQTPRICASPVGSEDADYPQQDAAGRAGCPESPQQQQQQEQLQQQQQQQQQQPPSTRAQTAWRLARAWKAQQSKDAEAQRKSAAEAAQALRTEHLGVVTECAGHMMRTLMDTVAVGKLHEDQARETTYGLLGALEHLRARGIVHRDVKPENVLLAHCGRPVLTNFALAARALDARELAQRVGTPGYMAPEVIMGWEIESGGKLDMFSLGVLVFFSMTCTMPFAGNSIASVWRRTVRRELDLESIELLKDASPLCKEFVGGLMSKDASKRMSASQALANRWILNTTSKRSSVMPVPGEASPTPPPMETRTFRRKRLNKRSSVLNGDKSLRLMSRTISAQSTADDFKSEAGSFCTEEPEPVDVLAPEKSDAVSPRRVIGAGGLLMPGSARRMKFMSGGTETTAGTASVHSESSDEGEEGGAGGAGGSEASYARAPVGESSR